MKYCSNKDIDQLIRKLVRTGWSFQRGRKHGRLTHPTGISTLTIANSPSDYRSLQNFRRDLRNVVITIKAMPRADSGGTSTSVFSESTGVCVGFD